jgi:hypothetical protein
VEEELAKEGDDSDVSPAARRRRAAASTNTEGPSGTGAGAEIGMGMETETGTVMRRAERVERVLGLQGSSEPEDAEVDRMMGRK